ncbi:MAG: hypothetical protein D3924_14375, partial [Candidatus Electrothrix sp. AR4]|nr:hypothetical protein [Candidatus Electrothrix sp. AR4]
MNRLDSYKKQIVTRTTFVIFAFTAGCTHTTGQNPAVDQNAFTKETSLDPTAMITAHNQWRSKTGVPDLQWSRKLAESAQKWADHLTQTSCTHGHSGGKYGENLYMADPFTSSDG